MSSQLQQRTRRLALSCWRVCVFWLLLSGIAGAISTLSAEESLVPHKDPELNDLLVQYTTTFGEPYDKAVKQLSDVPADRRQTGLAYALLWRKTREPALQYLNENPPDAHLMPFVIDAAKWGRGREILLAVRILRKNPDKRAIPVLLEFVLENSYQEWHTDRGPEGHAAIYMTADMWKEAADLLCSLTDGAIGNAGALTDWRDWWEKNRAKILPDWKPDDIGKDRDEIRKWCEQRVAFYGREATEEYETRLKQHVAEKGDLGDYAPDGNIYEFNCPAELESPAGTSVLILKILESAGQIPAAEPAPEKKDEVVKALQTHRVALLCLTGSKDRRPVSQFLLWALKNDKIKDLQAAACALGRMGEQEAAMEALKFILEQKITPKTLREATLSLGLTRSLKAIEPLVKILEKEDPPVADYSPAVDSLKKIGVSTASNGKAVVEAVSPMLTGPSANLAKAAISILGYVKSYVKSNEARDAIVNALPKMPQDAKTEAKRVLYVLWGIEQGNGESAPPTNGQPAHHPPTDGSTPTATDTGRTSGTPNSAGTATSSQGGAGGAVAEAAPFPWAIVIVVAIAALALGAITTLLLTRKNRREAEG